MENLALALYTFEQGNFHARLQDTHREINRRRATSAELLSVRNSINMSIAQNLFAGNMEPHIRVYEVATLFNSHQLLIQTCELSSNVNFRGGETLSIDFILRVNKAMIRDHFIRATLSRYEERENGFTEISFTVTDSAPQIQTQPRESNPNQNEDFNRNLGFNYAEAERRILAIEDTRIPAENPRAPDDLITILPYPFCLPIWIQNIESGKFSRYERETRLHQLSAAMETKRTQGTTNQYTIQEYNQIKTALNLSNERELNIIQANTKWPEPFFRLWQFAGINSGEAGVNVAIRRLSYFKQSGPDGPDRERLARTIQGYRYSQIEEEFLRELLQLNPEEMIILATRVVRREVRNANQTQPTTRPGARPGIQIPDDYSPDFETINSDPGQQEPNQNHQTISMGVSAERISEAMQSIQIEIDSSPSTPEPMIVMDSIASIQSPEPTSGDPIQPPQSANSALLTAMSNAGISSQGTVTGRWALSQPQTPEHTLPRDRIDRFNRSFTSRQNAINYRREFGLPTDDIYRTGPIDRNNNPDARWRLRGERATVREENEQVLAPQGIYELIFPNRAAANRYRTLHGRQTDRIVHELELTIENGRLVHKYRLVSANAQAETWEQPPAGGTQESNPLWANSYDANRFDRTFESYQQANDCRRRNGRPSTDFLYRCRQPNNQLGPWRIGGDEQTLIQTPIYDHVFNTRTSAQRCKRKWGESGDRIQEIRQPFGNALIGFRIQPKHSTAPFWLIADEPNYGQDNSNIRVRENHSTIESRPPEGPANNERETSNGPFDHINHIFLEALTPTTQNPPNNRNNARTRQNPTNPTLTSTPQPEANTMLLNTSLKRIKSLHDKITNPPNNPINNPHYRKIIIDIPIPTKE